MELKPDNRIVNLIYVLTLLGVTGWLGCWITFYKLRKARSEVREVIAQRDEALKRTDIYFVAGVQSAISVHLQYADREFRKGRMPLVAGIPVDQWLAEARLQKFP